MSSSQTQIDLRPEWRLLFLWRTRVQNVFLVTKWDWIESLLFTHSTAALIIQTLQIFRGWALNKRKNPCYHHGLTWQCQLAFPGGTKWTMCAAGANIKVKVITKHWWIISLQRFIPPLYRWIQSKQTIQLLRTSVEMPFDKVLDILSDILID